MVAGQKVTWLDNPASQIGALRSEMLIWWSDPLTYIYICTYIYINKDVSLVYAHCLAYVCMYIYIAWLIHRSNLVVIIDTVNFSEILHQLVDGLSPYNRIIYNVS